MAALWVDNTVMAHKGAPFALPVEQTVTNSGIEMFSLCKFANGENNKEYINVNDDGRLTLTKNKHAFYLVNSQDVSKLKNELGDQFELANCGKLRLQFVKNKSLLNVTAVRLPSDISMSEGEILPIDYTHPKARVPYFALAKSRFYAWTMVEKVLFILLLISWILILFYLVYILMKRRSTTQKVAQRKI